MPFTSDSELPSEAVSVFEDICQSVVIQNIFGKIKIQIAFYMIPINYYQLNNDTFLNFQSSNLITSSFIIFSSTSGFRVYVKMCRLDFEIKSC